MQHEEIVEKFEFIGQNSSTQKDSLRVNPRGAAWSFITFCNNIS
jgi:hypothetical protein